jgi:hypothetical protein
MANTTADEPTRVLHRPQEALDLPNRIFRIMGEACTELNNALGKHDLEFVAYLPDPHFSTRIADFRIHHISDGHEIGFVRAIAFIPLIANDAAGNPFLKGFTITLQINIDDTVRENINLQEDTLLDTYGVRETFKKTITGIIIAAVKKWAQ